MTRTSTDVRQIVQHAYDTSKDLIDAAARQTSAAYEDMRRWVPKHPTAVAMSASAALCIGAFGYALGRRRHADTSAEHAMSAAIARTPELDLSPFFRFVKLWMLYRVATKD